MFNIPFLIITKKKIVHGMDGRGPIFVESPQSPLSLMDAFTIGSPATILGGTNATEISAAENVSSNIVSESSSSSNVTVASAQHFNASMILEPPPAERLLPIGASSSTTTRNTQCNRERMLDDQGRIFDRVWQVFGSMEKSNSDGYV